MNDPITSTAGSHPIAAMYLLNTANLTYKNERLEEYESVYRLREHS